MPTTIEVMATLLFAVAILHTFSISRFARLAHAGGKHAGVWHLLAEVEIAFGIWAFALFVMMACWTGTDTAVRYVESRNFTEPLFVFVMMVVAASRPILECVEAGVRLLARVLPLRDAYSMFFLLLAMVPLMGALMTEPAAMTVAALLLRDRYFHGKGQGFEKSEYVRFKYLTLGVLFVNVSIGGVLTAYAAPAVLMVATPFKWDTAYMATHFGWRAVIAVFLNAGILTFISRKILRALAIAPAQQTAAHPRARSPFPVPWPIVGLHVLLLASVVLSAHHPAIFLGLMMLFMGGAEAYPHYQNRLLIKEGLRVSFFLAGLVVLGGLQQWWLQNLLGDLAPSILFWGSAGLTAIVDNAALTYLGTLVTGTQELWRYMLVAGAVTGGGLTIIANAPNPAGCAILKPYFPGGSIGAGRLLLAALLPTLVAAGMFLVTV